ncbi:MAG: hypothetical protein AAF108_02665 [Planctomycetota bacterium]
MVILIDDETGTLAPCRQQLDELGVAHATGDPSPGDVVIVAGAKAAPDGPETVVLRVPAGGSPDERLEALREAASLSGATLAVGQAGSINAALFAARVLAARGDDGLRDQLQRFAGAQRDTVRANPDPSSLGDRD